LRLNKDFADYTKPAFRSANLGGRAGGFFIKNKLFLAPEF